MKAYPAGAPTATGARMRRAYDPLMSLSRTQEARRRARAEKIQRALDEALADTFPASDPVSIVTSHDEEDWGEPDDATEPSAPASSPPGSRS